MEYQYVPPVPRVHRVTIDGGLKVYQDVVWCWDDYDTPLTEPVKTWLDENAPKARVTCDRGDWGEGIPVFYIDFPSEAQAMSFIDNFAQPEAVDRELRTLIVRPVDGFLKEEVGLRVLNDDVFEAVRQYETTVVINSDDEGEFVLFEFASREDRNEFDNYVWKNWTRPSLTAKPSTEGSAE